MVVQNYSIRVLDTVRHAIVMDDVYSVVIYSYEFILHQLHVLHYKMINFYFYQTNKVAILFDTRLPQVGTMLCRVNNHGARE